MTASILKLPNIQSKRIRQHAFKSEINSALYFQALDAELPVVCDTFIAADADTVFCEFSAHSYNPNC